ncbi:hypothetical protein [Wolbachia endosymbiont of Brugia pahangi]|nr:hypothetical protein [Wolbachia endosymbiont of Brugia pahangi]
MAHTKNFLIKMECIRPYEMCESVSFYQIKRKTKKLDAYSKKYVEERT